MSAEANRTIIEQRTGLKPKIALVLGSGLGGFVEDIADPVTIAYDDLAGFPATGVSGHAGAFVIGRLSGVAVAVLSGRAHYYEHGNPAEMRPALETLRAIGVERLILTNSAGSLDPGCGPGSVMLIGDHINFAGHNPLIGEPSDARFVGLTEAYDPEFREGLKAAANRTGIDLPEGVYMWFSGPSFETPAEIRAARTLGADAVGMSTVPEVILARFLGIRVAALSVITNLAAGMTGAELSHQETKDMAPQGGAKLARIIAAYLEGQADD
jgi:purine-nucleoside phosphorylase